MFGKHTNFPQHVFPDVHFVRNGVQPLVGAMVGGLALQQSKITPESVGQQLPAKPLQAGYFLHFLLGWIGLEVVGSEVGVAEQQASVTPLSVGQQFPAKPLQQDERCIFLPNTGVSWTTTSRQSTTAREFATLHARFGCWIVATA